MDICISEGGVCQWVHGGSTAASTIKLFCTWCILVFYRRVKALVDMELVRDGEAESGVLLAMEHDFWMVWVCECHFVTWSVENLARSWKFGQKLDCIARFIKMHCTLKSVCTGAKVMEDPRRVPWHRAVGLLDKEGPGGDFEGLWRSLRPHLSISRWVHPNVGWFMSIYVDLCRFMSIIWAWIPFWISNCFHSFCLINSNPIKELPCVFATLEVVARRVLLGSNESIVLSSLQHFTTQHLIMLHFLDSTFSDSCFFVGFAKEMEKTTTW